MKRSRGPSLTFSKMSENVLCNTADVTWHNSKMPLPRKPVTSLRDGQQVTAGVFKALRDMMMSFLPLMPPSLAEQNNSILILSF